MGCSEVSPGLFQTEGKGTFKAYTRGKVGIFSASGVFLDCLRRVPGRFREYLGVIASYPHRVSLLHLTADYMVESSGAYPGGQGKGPCWRVVSYSEANPTGPGFGTPGRRSTGPGDRYGLPGQAPECRCLGKGL